MKSALKEANRDLREISFVHANGSGVPEEDISEARSLEDLPEACRNYLDFISDFLDVPIVLMGVGPERTQIILSGDRAADFARS